VYASLRETESRNATEVRAVQVNFVLAICAKSLAVSGQAPK
jgi:hypothetical protein